jgi:hypothetical protein
MAPCAEIENDLENNRRPCVFGTHHCCRRGLSDAKTGRMDRARFQIHTGHIMPELRLRYMTVGEPGRHRQCPPLERRGVTGVAPLAA